MESAGLARLEDEALYLALENIPLSVVLTNPHLPDNPLIYVNRTFENATGYSKLASVGRNCRFLQGPDTDPETTSEIARNIVNRQEFTIDILNYRADGEPFWNRLHITPLFGKDGDLRFFLGVQRILGNRREATIVGGTEDQPLREMTHRVKNHLAMVVSLIRLQARSRSDDPQADYTNLARRVESLQILYHELSEAKSDLESSAMTDLSSYIQRIVTTMSGLALSRTIRTEVIVPPIAIKTETAAHIGLLLSEILTNAYQHAFAERQNGTIRIQVKRNDDRIKLRVRDNGNGIPEGRNWPESGSLGGQIVRSLIGGLNASLEVVRLDPGTEINISFDTESGQQY